MKIDIKGTLYKATISSPAEFGAFTVKANGIEHMPHQLLGNKIEFDTDDENDGVPLKLYNQRFRFDISGWIEKLALDLIGDDEKTNENALGIGVALLEVKVREYPGGQSVNTQDILNWPRGTDAEQDIQMKVLAGIAKKRHD